jgi:hypothetical protein
MKLKGPFYDGDSILRPRPIPAIIYEATSAPKDEIVHSTTVAAEEPISLSIEERARGLRHEYIANLLQAAHTGLARWFEHVRRRDQEIYLGKAQNHADLETRIRRLEQIGHFG